MIHPLHLRLRILSLTIIPFCFVESAVAEQGSNASVAQREMETDRPDFTEGVNTIAPYGAQIEGGYTFTRDTEAGTQEQHTIPELLGRIGISEGAELRLGWVGWEKSWDSREGTAEGLTDLIFGMKGQIGEPDLLPVQLSFIAELEVPSGSSDTRETDVIPQLKLLWASDLGASAVGEMGIAGNLNFALPVDDEGRYPEASGSLAMSVDLDDSWGAYIELFGFIPENGAERVDEAYLNGGFTYAVTETCQLDARVGAGINDDAADFFTGVGGAVLF
jgi:hypothetical protein